MLLILRYFPWILVNVSQLRERLSNDQKAISTAETSLQAELAQIGEELSAFKLPRSPTKFSPATKPPFSTVATDTTSPPNPALSTITATVASLSATVTATLAALTVQSATLAKDVETSLVVTERRARQLDDLRREANAENEALYDRFNEELGRVLLRVRAGDGVEELRAQLKEAWAEAGRLRAENRRLRREAVGGRG